jgi:alpha-1,4-digalacturonate transport system substrate-binding protein
MARKLSLVLLFVFVVLVGSLGSPAKAQSPLELRMLWYDDGQEGKVMRDLLDRYEARTPGIKVIMDTVPFKDIHDTLQRGVDAGQASDLARVTDLARFHGQYLDLRPYLTDAKAWEATFPEAALRWLRRPGTDDKGLYGFPSQFGLSGPFVNVTLFEQAGIPVPTGKTSFAHWVELATEVARNTNTPYAVAIDRSGHRMWGPALSMGATFIDRKTGRFSIDTPGFRTFAQMLIDWHRQGITPKDIWAGAGGAYRSGKEYFVNGQLVFYFSGSWQVGDFTTQIADKFDWKVIDQPCGEAACTGIPGGAAIVAMASTKHPSEVARLVEYISSEAVLAEFYSRSLFLPAQVNLIKHGLDFPSSKEALSAFVAQIPKLTEEAYALQGSPVATAVLNPEMRDRLSQVIVGELTLDEAIIAIQKKMDTVCDAAPIKCQPY